MRSESQTIMITLAITVAIALALAVAFFFVSALRESTEPTAVRSETLPAPRSTAPPPPQTVPTTETTAEETVPTGVGLLFCHTGKGVCRLTGIGSCADACVIIPDYSPDGDLVTEIAEKAFFGCASVTAVQIPASVQKIGNLAFADCPNLVYLSVSNQNPYFLDADGVLYSHDRRTLILYPPKRAGSTAVITRETKEIREMAFYRCEYLKSIQYTGTAEEWEQIVIGTRNYGLIAAAKTFAGY